jgi:hypothetical protein
MPKMTVVLVALARGRIRIVAAAMAAVVAPENLQAYPRDRVRVAPDRTVMRRVLATTAVQVRRSPAVIRVANRYGHRKVFPKPNWVA